MLQCDKRGIVITSCAVKDRPGSHNLDVRTSVLCDTDTGVASAWLCQRRCTVYIMKAFYTCTCRIKYSKSKEQIAEKRRLKDFCSQTEQICPITYEWLTLCTEYSIPNY